MKRAIVILACAAALFVAATPAAGGGDTADAIDRYMKAWHECGRFNGSVLVAKDGHTVFKKGYGLADVAKNTPNRPDTKFNTHSVSKQFTTVMVFQLAAEGRLALDDKLTKFLPGYRRDTGDRVTVDFLLRHTAGIPCYINDSHRRPEGRPKYEWGGRYDRDAFVEEYLSGDFLFEPGTQYKYSNTGYFLLALIVESVTGRTYAENLRDRITEPLGLENTGVLQNGSTPDKIAIGYRRAPSGLTEVPYENPDNLLGAGNIYSTVEDLTRWNLALERGELLPETWREKMFTVYREEGREKNAYSLNYFSLPSPSGGEFVYTGFSGGGPGFNSDVFRFPDEKLIVAILDNSTQYNHWRMAPSIYQIFKGRDPRMPKPLLADALVKTVADEGLDAALEQYRDISANRRDNYERGSAERDLNSYGYSVLATGDTGLAIAIFRLNVALYPESWNVYDSLGEAYLAAGEQELSDKNYAIAREKREREQTIIALMRDGQFDRAREVVESARRENPDLIVLTGPRVGPFFDQTLSRGEHEQALEICRVWALSDPAGAGPLFSMARVYTAMGDPASAGDCYRKIIENDPDGRAASFARERLEALEAEQ
jgi:CubicO group peptidase (beta-lactamase class C family)